MAAAELPPFTFPRQSSSIRFAEYPYVQSTLPGSYIANSQNQTHTNTRNSHNRSTIINFNYYGKEPSSSTESVDTEETSLDEVRTMPDAGGPSASKRRGSKGDVASLFSQTETIKRNKHAANRRSRYTSAETVMSMSEGECRLVPLERHKVKFPSPHISRQVERYMRTNFFDSAFVIPLWKTSHGYAQDKPIQDEEAKVMTLGDIGYFDKEGGFTVLFNVYKTVEENLRRGHDPPKDFRHYVPPPDQIISRSAQMRAEEYIPLHGDFKESDWPYDTGRDYVFSCESPLSKDAMQAAALSLPDGFTRHVTLVGALAAMQDYFNEHAAAWYNYYSTDIRKRDGLVEGSLKLITTCYTSKTYGAAVFVKQPTQQAEQVFAALYRQSKEEDVYLWERKGVVRTRSGPTPKEMVNNKAEYESQCVAIEVTAIKIRKKSFFVGDPTETMRAQFVAVVNSKSQSSWHNEGLIS
ncbi:hypothetical protein D9613_002464 [Agrocybe pediades]|uniref:Uncharacterized protein n=1 Tax=Agrocybe pediades TaxID=84607 RepID=A0A8H4VM47_9AGAR|nr:hypothetical protein D9613_002464 [Agrocybe pediades]